MDSEANSDFLLWKERQAEHKKLVSLKKYGSKADDFYRISSFLVSILNLIIPEMSYLDRFNCIVNRRYLRPLKTEQSRPMSLKRNKTLILCTVL